MYSIQEVSNNACLQMESLAVPEEVSTVRKGVKDWITYVNCSEEQVSDLCHITITRSWC